MKEVMRIVLERWLQYWGESAYLWIFCAAALYLFLFKRKKEYVKNVLLYELIILLIFWFPLTAAIIQKCLGQSVYWRILWLLMNVPVCALAIVELIKDKKSKVKALLLTVAIVLIAISGKSILKAGVYEKAHNYQKIPYEAVVVCDLVKNDAGEKKVHLAADDYLASYVRVYDASITMPYGRAGRGYVNKKSKKLYNEICSGEKNYALIAEYAKELECNYIVCSVSDSEGITIMEENGFCVIGSVNQYTIFSYKV